MIIDDDEDINNLFKIFLEFHGYIVNSYTDAVDALNYFKKDLYTLVLLDLKMRKIDGFKLYRKLRNIDENIRICFITADIKHGRELQKEIPNIENIVIYKPILLKDLKSKIDSLLS